MSQTRRFLLYGVGLVAIILCLGTQARVIAQASSTTGTISGTVSDQQGGRVSGAVVMAKNLSTNLTREAVTSEIGEFSIPQLPPGSYELKATAEGFKASLLRLDLELGITTRTEILLSLGALSDVIEVTGNGLFLEGRTESSRNIDVGLISNLPINQRNFLDFSLTSPRVTPDRLPVQGAGATSGLSFNGQPARQNSLTIDGLDNNDLGAGTVRSTFSQDAVQEFQVVSDGYSAEFGRALGGVINIVTKGGGNQFHGTTFFFIRNDEISAREPFASFEPPFRQYQFGATLSGPIKQDKAFFFTSFERLSVKQNNIVTISDATVRAARNQGFQLSNGPIPVGISGTNVLGRVDFRLRPDNQLALRYNYGGAFNSAFEPFGALIGESVGGIQDLADNSLALNNTYINSGLRLINETRFLYSRRRQRLTPVIDEVGVGILAPEGNVRIGRGDFLPQPRNLDTYQILNNVSLQRGINQLKFGADFIYIKSRGRVPLVAGGIASFTPIDFGELAGIPGLPVLSSLQALDPSLRTKAQRDFLTVLAGILPSMAPGFPANLPLADLGLPFIYFQGFQPFSNMTAPTKMLGVFVQDDIRVRPNLLLKAGLRYDVDRTRFAPKNDGNLSPRIAFAYRPGRLPNLNIHGAYGIFFAAQLNGSVFIVQPASRNIVVLPFPFSIIPFSLRGHRFPESEQVPAGVTVQPQLGQQVTFDPNLRSSYTQQGNFGLDYELGKNNVISAKYNFVRGLRLLAIREINPIVRPTNDPLESALIGRVDPSKGSILEFESAYDSYYHGLTLGFERRFTNRVGISIFYTFSKIIDNFVDINPNLPISTPNNSLDIRSERGLSIQDVRNRFVTSGVWELSYTKNPLLRDFQLSTIVTLESGRPYNLLAGIDLNRDGDSPAGDRPLGIGRNTGITPGFANVDLRLTRAIKLNENSSFQFTLEAFNLFNRVNISDIDPVFPPDQQGRFILPQQQDGRFITSPDRFRGAFAPRRLQFGFRFIY
ncbi:MAG: TonB-dependent receptor [Acidobacteriota bacterium]